MVIWWIKGYLMAHQWLIGEFMANNGKLMANYWIDD